MIKLFSRKGEKILNKMCYTIPIKSYIIHTSKSGLKYGNTEGGLVAQLFEAHEVSIPQSLLSLCPDIRRLFENGLFSLTASLNDWFETLPFYRDHKAHEKKPF